MIDNPKPFISSSSNNNSQIKSSNRLSQNQRRANERQAFNHLLGFTLPPRSSHSNQYSSSSSSSRRPLRRQHAHDSYQDKNRFVHARYRFILKPTGDYTVHFSDPDIRFNWSDILQVIVNVSSAFPIPCANTPNLGIDHVESFEKHDCPVCLSEPRAARMTKCGHIFCYPCILHYIELSDEAKGQGRKCPVCYETILKKDLKSVKRFDCASEAQSSHQPGSNLMNFRLIERPNLTTLALPRSHTWPSPAVQTHDSPWHFTPDALTFAKFIVASPDYMTSELNRDLEELQEELMFITKRSTSRDESDDLTIVFIKAAEAKVKEQIEKVGLLKTNHVMTERKRAMRKITETIQQFGEGQDQAQLEICTTTDEEVTTPAPVQIEHTIYDDLDRPTYLPNQLEHALVPTSARDVPATIKLDAIKPLNSPVIKLDALSPTIPKTRKNINPPEPTSTTYRFYQAGSGEQIFLSALDVRVLLAKFGSFDCFPDSITLNVESWSEVRVSDDLRRRYRYLSHLPTGSEVRMVEVDLSEYLGNDCSLIEAARKRIAKRKEKIKKEDKAKAKSEMIEQSSWNTFSTVKPAAQDWDDSSDISLKFKPTQKSVQSLSSDEPVMAPSARETLQARSSRNAVQFGNQQPGGSRTVWGTYVPTNKTNSNNSEVTFDLDDEWTKHSIQPALPKSRRWLRAQLNTEDLDNTDDDQTQENGKKNGSSSADGTNNRKKGKQKSRKHQNQFVINLSGGLGGRKL